MSSSESGEISDIRETPEKLNSELEFVSKFVKEHAVMIDKGKTPSITHRKNVALELLVEDFQSKFGKPTNIKKLLKQINNLKSAVKKKTDSNATGNKKIIFSLAEKNMYEAMQSENSPNPVLNKLHGNISIGTKKTSNLNKESAPSTSQLSIAKRPPPPPSPTLQTKKSSILNKYETEETKKLTNSELQRLVLLEELQLIRLKKKKLENELQQPEIIQENEKTFVNL